MPQLINTTMNFLNKMNPFGSKDIPQLPTHPQSPNNPSPSNHCHRCQSTPSTITTTYYQHPTCHKQTCIWCVYFLIHPRDPFFPQSPQETPPPPPPLPCCHTPLPPDSLQTINHFLTRSCVICGPWCQSVKKVFLNNVLWVGKECFYRLYIKSEKTTRDKATLAKIMGFGVVGKCDAGNHNAQVRVLDGERCEREFRTCCHCFQVINKQKMGKLLKCSQCGEGSSTYIKNVMVMLTFVQFQSKCVCVPCLFGKFQQEYSLEGHYNLSPSTNHKAKQIKQLQRRMLFQQKMLQGCFCCSQRVPGDKKVYRFPCPSDTPNDLLKYSCLDCLLMIENPTLSNNKKPTHFQQFSVYIKKHYGKMDEQTRRALERERVVFQMEVELVVMGWEREVRGLEGNGKERNEEGRYEEMEEGLDVDWRGGEVLGEGGVWGDGGMVGGGNMGDWGLINQRRHDNDDNSIRPNTFIKLDRFDVDTYHNEQDYDYDYMNDLPTIYTQQLHRNIEEIPIPSFPPQLSQTNSTIPQPTPTLQCKNPGCPNKQQLLNFGLLCSRCFQDYLIGGHDERGKGRFEWFEEEILSVRQKGQG